MISLTQAVKKTVLVIFWLMLFSYIIGSDSRK